ncbi:hypothetical protein ACFHWD_03550 [Clostridium sp. MT-14]|uniref:hypothetical protein n=1 Tax=Clostridium sp. MT-14 TaxID=3348360 RepID=UPI0035F362B6
MGKVIDYINSLNITKKRQFLITKRSLKLAAKIKKEIGVDVFPIIIRQYLGSMHNEAGYCTWYMLDRTMNMIGSADSTSDLLLKKNIIEICWYEGDNIYISFCLKEAKNV